MNYKELLNELRNELRAEFGGRIEAIETQYNTLALSYHEVIKDVHHHLGGSIARLEGLYLLEIMDGAKFKHKEMWDLAFAKADIYRRKIQTKYIDSVHL